MTGRLAAWAVAMVVAGCASAPSVREEKEIPVSQLRWDFERDMLPGRHMGSLLGWGFAGRALGITGAAAGGELGSLQEGIPMSLPELAGTLARALGQASADVTAAAGMPRRAEGGKSPGQTLLGRSLAPSATPPGAPAGADNRAGGAAAEEGPGAGGRAVPLALATPDRYVTDWRDIPGREAGVLWWRKPWQTEIRHEVRALPSSRDPARLSNVAIDSELRERPNASYPWQPAEVATPAARAAHAEIRARVLATIRAAVDLKRSPPR